MPALDYGLEIECLVPEGTTQLMIAQAIAAAGVPCIDAGYSHVTSATSWKVVRDGSLQPGLGRVGMEVVSPPLTETGIPQVETVCRVLQERAATVNKSCGLHVHVGVRHYPMAALRKLAELYADYEPVIDSLLPPSRRGTANNYCRTLRNLNRALLSTATAVNQIASSVAQDRYGKINFQAFWRYGTVEFRHHSGTVEAHKIMAWVRLCNALVAEAVRAAPEPIFVPVVQQQAATASWRPSVFNHRYWHRSPQLRILRSLLMRPEGVTNLEFQGVLGRRTLPSISFHLERAGAPVAPQGRRAGYAIYRLVEPPPVVTESSPVPEVTARPTPTLQGMCERLQLSVEERQFWAARAAQLAGPLAQAAE